VPRGEGREGGLVYTCNYLLFFFCSLVSTRCCRDSVVHIGRCLSVLSQGHACMRTREKRHVTYYLFFFHFPPQGRPRIVHPLLSSLDIL